MRKSRLPWVRQENEVYCESRSDLGIGEVVEVIIARWF